MPIQSATFKTIEVHQFLESNRYSYSAKCFYTDTIGQDRVPADFVRKWFKRQFVAGLSARLYRLLETVAPQHMEIA